MPHGILSSFNVSQQHDLTCLGVYINRMESIEESTLACNWTLTCVSYDMSTK